MAIAVDPPNQEFALCDWVRCEGYLGTKTLTDSECRNQPDLARLSGDLYRQHLLRGTRSKQQEVLVRIATEDITLRVSDLSSDDSRQVVLDRQFAVCNIARCSSGHDPFPQVLVIVDCIGVRPSAEGGGNDARVSLDAWTLEMCCHGIACRDGAEAGRLAKLVNRAFQESLRLRTLPRPFSIPQAADQRVGRNTISTIATPVGYTMIDPPAYMATGHAAVSSLRNVEKKSAKGLPEVGSW
ncbi:uncharacterized protein [Diadema antillarum]|uniref:uncharacterized protein n=1 Tax=Diadema antillarum TaxID=105358 RepID=UPI003A8C779A